MGQRVADAEAVRDSTCLVLRWQLDKPTAVIIAAGLTPLSKDHTRLLRAEAGTQEAHLDSLRAGRIYVSITPVEGGAPFVVSERRLAFEGAKNFRDLGGYKTGDDQFLRWGAIFRSDSLHQLTEADLLVFNSIGVRTVYDLRSNAERSEAPDPVEPVALEIVSVAPGEEGPGLAGIATTLDAERLLRDIYVGMLANSALLFGQLFTGLATPGRLPAVFHCAGGKDRTGMTAALMLSALDVERETVLDDYELTARWRTIEDERELFRTIVGAGVPEEAALAFFGAPRWAMAEALDVLDKDYGGVQAYLSGPAGMEPSAVLGLKKALTSG